MEAPMKAIEVTGTVDDEGRLTLDEAVTILGTGRVRVILLLAENGDLDEAEWLRAGGNRAFDFLRDPAEDIYTIDDGKPFRQRS